MTFCNKKLDIFNLEDKTCAGEVKKLAQKDVFATKGEKSTVCFIQRKFALKTLIYVLGGNYREPKP